MYAIIYVQSASSPILPLLSYKLLTEITNSISELVVKVVKGTKTQSESIEHLNEIHFSWWQIIQTQINSFVFPMIQFK